LSNFILSLIDRRSWYVIVSYQRGYPANVTIVVMRLAGKEGDSAMDKIQARKEAHEIIDSMKDEDIEEARLLLRELVESREKYTPGRRMSDEERMEWLNSLPEEEEELSDEALKGIEEGERACKEGRCRSWEEAARELGI
jgi:hypothetical protein